MNFMETMTYVWIQKVLSEGSNYESILFLVGDAREDPNTTISGLSSAHQRNAIAGC